MYYVLLVIKIWIKSSRMSFLSSSRSGDATWVPCKAYSMQAKDSEGGKLLASKIEFRNTVPFWARFECAGF